MGASTPGGTMRSPERWLAVGGAIFGAGALLVISWLIYAIGSRSGFWSWPGITGVVVALVGLVALAVGFAMPKEGSEAPSSVPQTLHAGTHSTNSQAGRDSLQAARDLFVGDHPRKDGDDS
jgi:hypothetical protein